MFDNFTFGAVSRTNHDEILASPTDMSFAKPPTSFPFSPEDSYEDLSDIVQQLSRQSLTREERVRGFASWAEISNGPLEVDSDEDMSSIQATVSSPATAAHSLPMTEESFSSRRMQRQFHTQLQLSTSHLRDINSLVEHMIESNSQCRLQSRRPSSRSTHTQNSPSLPLAHELEVDPLEDGSWCGKAFEIDEGFCEIFDPTKSDDEMSLRMASAPSGIRKYGPLKWGRSADACIGGRAKVKSKPRMRKRSAPK